MHVAISALFNAAEWAFSNGDNPLFRIVLCGYERTAPEGWRSIVCKNRSGYAKGDRARKAERLFLSPHCLKEE